MCKLVELKKVSKAYGKTKILNNINVILEKGKCYGLLGVNGAGKSTFLKLICSIVEATSGTIEKENITIGFMIEEPVFHNDLSVYKNLSLYASLLEKINETEILNKINLLGLTEYKSVKYKKLSMGNKQRLYFAYSILGNPELLILDEPFNYLDPLGIKLINDIIKMYIAAGKTVIISSHQIKEIEGLIDEAIIIDKGFILEKIPVTKEINLEEYFIEKITKK